MCIQMNATAQRNILDLRVKHVRKSLKYTFAMADKMTLCYFNLVYSSKWTIKQSVFLIVTMGHVQVLSSAHVTQDILVLVVD